MTGPSSSAVAVRAAPAGGVRGALAPPPSKSLTQRYFALALLASSASVVRRPLRAEDTERFLSGLEVLGCTLERGDGWVRIERRAAPAGGAIDCGAGGTMLRFLTACCCVVPGRWRLDGSARLRQRPVGPLVAALNSLGATIEAAGAEGFAPLRVGGGRLDGGAVRLDAGESSQFVSALLLAASRAAGPVAVRVTRLASAPYLELTLAAMAEFGVRVERPEEGRFRVSPRAFPGREVAVEADASAAAYPAAAAALTGGEVELAGLAEGSLQGDVGFLGLLERMGAEVRWLEGGVAVRGSGRLEAIEADLGGMPDQVPTLAALAPFARGETRIRGVPHLRLKESDRLRAMAVELRRLGATAAETSDGLVVPGVWAGRAAPRDRVVVDSHDDHRIAMSLALVGLRRPGVHVAAPGVVGKSYPGFWRDLEAISGG